MKPSRVVVLLGAVVGLGAGCEWIAGVQDIHLTGSADAGGDQASDDSGDEGGPACTPVSSAGTLCATVQLDSSASIPDYTSTGAQTLGINGVGTVAVLLFDKDPGDPTNRDLLPKAVLQSPNAGAVKMADLPVSVVGTAPAGKYWAFAVFEDGGPNPATRNGTRGKGRGVALPGDLAQVAMAGPAGVVYPQVTLGNGNATMAALNLRPMRALSLTLQPSLALVQQAKGNASIAGDGPATVYVYQGSFVNNSAVIDDFGLYGCIDLGLQSMPMNPTVTMGVLATGSSDQLFAAVYDYDLPTDTNPLPAGVVSSDPNGTPITIDPASWITMSNLAITTDPFPVPADAGAMHVPCP